MFFVLFGTERIRFDPNPTRYDWIRYELIQPNSTYTNSSNFMFSYFSVNCVFNIIEYFSYLNLWLVILFLFIMAFFLVLGSTQLINSSRLCSDVVFEASLVLFSFVLIAIIISPALIILLDLELIIMPSFIIYSCGVQWLWSFSLTYLNWISNCDHYVYSSYLVSSRFASFRFELASLRFNSLRYELSGADWIELDALRFNNLSSIYFC